MLTVDEVFAMDMEVGHFYDLSVTGLLVVFDDLAYLCSSDAQRKPAILIASTDLPADVLERLPCHSTSKLTRAGSATVAGSVSKTGLDMFEYSIADVRRITFRDSHGTEADYRLDRV
jgi:hypothetical protein